MKKPLIIALALSLTNLLFGEVFYVSTTGSDSNDGKSWESAKRTLGGALEDAVSSDEIWIAEGTYYPSDGDYNRYKFGSGYSFRLKDDIKVFGGFPQSGNPKFSDRNPRVYETIFDGAQNSSCVVYLSGLSDFLLDGITITGGIGGGSAMRISGGIVNNCIIKNNNSSYATAGEDPDTQFSPKYVTASVSGVVIMSGGTISNCTFVDNVAYASATSKCGNGAHATVYVTSAVSMSDGKVLNSTFIRNSATSYVEAYSGSLNDAEVAKIYSAGAITISGGEIVNSTFTQNSSVCTAYGRSIEKAIGSAIRMTGGKVSHCTITNNTGDGNAIYLSDNHVVKNSIIYGNSQGPNGAFSIVNI